jgi:nucleoside-diphosphate-sugar epimerase
MEAINSKVQQVLQGNHTLKSSGKGKTVLITGGSGFVAAHCLNAFLSRGYNVKTTVRSQSSAEKIKKSHAKYIAQLSFAVVPDVATPRGHDEAVKGVDGVCTLPYPPVPSAVRSHIDVMLAGNPHSFSLSRERR